MDGFVSTVKMGVRSLELDVVISKDGQVVVSHEPWMHYKFCSEPDGSRVRMKSQHNLYKLDYTEIRKFDCGKKGNRDFPRQQPAPAHKPLLSEVIAALEQLTIQDSLSPIEYIIEIKSHDKTDDLFHPQPARYAQLLYNELKKFRINEKIIVKSFDVRPLQEMHELDPSLRIGLLVANLSSVEKNVKKLGFTPYTYNPSHRIVKAKTVEQAHSMGMKVMVWTVNSEEEIREIGALGVDGIITDYPDVAFKVLEEKQ